MKDRKKLKRKRRRKKKNRMKSTRISSAASKANMEGKEVVEEKMEGGILVRRYKGKKVDVEE